MSEYSPHAADDDPAQLVRTIGRLAQMIVELRDEYVTHHREDDIDQIERRLGELADLHQRLRAVRRARGVTEP